MSMTMITGDLIVGLISVGFFTAFFLITVTLMNIISPKRSVLSRQINYYNVKRYRGQEEQAEEEGKLKVIDAAVKRTENIVAKKSYTQDIDLRLEQAGLSIKAAEFVFFQVSFVLFFGFMALTLSGKYLVALIVIFITSFIPFAGLEVMKQNRLRAFHEQLPETLSLMSGALRAGYSFLQAVRTAVDEGEKPASAEFARVIAESNLGMPLDDALKNMAERMKDENFDWAVLAIKMQREVGGNLAEILDILAATIRERDYVKRQIKVLTSEGRLSAVILVGLPIAMAALIAIVNPGYFQLFYTSSIGLAMVGLAVVLLTMGTLWLMKIVKIDV